MPFFRVFIVLLMLAGLPVSGVAADLSDSLEEVRNLAQAGAMQLALRRIDTLQPSDTAAPSPEGTSSGAPPKGGASLDARWTEWESLRLQLLEKLGRHDEILRRAGLLPLPVPAGHVELHMIAARSAVLQRQFAAARVHAARVLWSNNPDTRMVRELRLLVIRSYAGESRSDDAWRSMLRFEQDYRPLDAVTAADFVNMLLDLGMAREALNWLGLLEERGATKLRLQLHSGVVTPLDAVSRAREAMLRGQDPAWWRIVLEAAERQKNGALRMEALEQLLDAGVFRNAGASAPADAKQLWDAYSDYARNAANHHHLLAGDDAGWLAFAIDGAAAEPVIARAYFAHLVHHGRESSLQRTAEVRLAESYANAKLSRAALLMFSAPEAPGMLDVRTRHVLGGLAENLGDHVRALGYWGRTPAPQNMSGTAWQLRLAAVALRAGNIDAATEIVRQLTAEPSVISASQLPEWMNLARQFTDHGLYDAAQILFEHLLRHADASQTSRVMSGAERNHEARGQAMLAPEIYLRSALQPPLTGPAATTARLQAGFSLLRAGLREDARAQFEWLLKNAESPEQIAVARRELGF